MPIFEYRCTKCGARFEALVSSSAALAACETCGSKQVEKQLSTFSAGMTSPTSPCAEAGCGRAGTGCGGGCPIN
ncbi:zinc ribbon domain-containing protein [Pontiella sp.]|uniref:FmdB family zinc ribbon protein n=1 Tax=Pontiella sp. TaxID=2837462 RepID=UPI0035635AE9